MKNGDNKGNSSIRIRMYEGRSVLFYKNEILTVYFRELNNSYFHYLSGNKSNLTNHSFQEIINTYNNLKDIQELFPRVLKEFENGTYNIKVEITKEDSHSDLDINPDHWFKNTYESILY